MLENSNYFIIIAMVYAYYYNYLQENKLVLNTEKKLYHEILKNYMVG